MGAPSPVLSEAHRSEMLVKNSRYELFTKIASGGMASVYLGRLRGAANPTALVAVKRAHSHLLDNPDFKSTLKAEASLAARIHHPNVVELLDVEEFESELLLVMEYIEGASLWNLLGTKARPMLPPRIAVRIALDACAGLDAAHALTDDQGSSLSLIHRDISPQNILVGVDGVARLTDFGIAKCSESTKSSTGFLKGKAGYMAPEYIDGRGIDHRADIFGLGVVLWESLAQQRLFAGSNDAVTLHRVVNAPVPPITSIVPEVGLELGEVLKRALDRSPYLRFQRANEFAEALQEAAELVDMIATREEVGRHVHTAFADVLSARSIAIEQAVASGRDSGDWDGPSVDLPTQVYEPISPGAITRPSLDARSDRRAAKSFRTVVTLLAGVGLVTAAGLGLRAAYRPEPSPPAQAEAPVPGPAVSPIVQPISSPVVSEPSLTEPRVRPETSGTPAKPRRSPPKVSSRSSSQPRDDKAPPSPYE